MTDLGALHHFLGITATRDQHGLFLSQASYTRDILWRASIASCKPCTTLVDTSTKLSATDGELFADGTLYRTLAGALQYLTLLARVTVDYGLQLVASHSHTLTAYSDMLPGVDAPNLADLPPTIMYSF
ncbi:uncharacterized mitochondrial protein AtMg00810-like [Lactuca sativa]|uniref:uncharacterized mitochondrial protein AtMg00810-like n=1 Tax=Lactuca sativa TaxID=4236 RepID=UPI0022AFA349|nr:uncharacterized mitochondrial protein AtMg00810-like [Lactuca sativa]